MKWAPEVLLANEYSFGESLAPTATIGKRHTLERMLVSTGFEFVVMDRSKRKFDRTAARKEARNMGVWSGDVENRRPIHQF